MRPVTEDARVTPLELFFDLVFVYASAMQHSAGDAPTS